MTRSGSCKNTKARILFQGWICSMHFAVSVIDSSIPGFPCKVQCWVWRKICFPLFFKIKLLLTWSFIFWSFLWWLFSCWITFLYTALPNIYFIVCISLSISNCALFTLFIWLWVRRTLLFLLPLNYKRNSNGCFHFPNLYKTHCQLVTSQKLLSHFSLFVKCTFINLTRVLSFLLCHGKKYTHFPLTLIYGQNLIFQLLQ